MQIKYSLLSRGKHVDYRWNRPCEDAQNLFSIGRDEEAPVIVLQLLDDGERANLLIGGLVSKLRQDRIGTKIRDAIFLHSLSERQARALLVSFAKNPELLVQTMDSAIGIDESENGWTDINPKKILDWVTKSVQETVLSSDPWITQLQKGEPFGSFQETLNFVERTFSKYELPRNAEAHLAVFAKYLRMERRFEEIKENSFLVRCDMFKESIRLPEKKTKFGVPPWAILSLLAVGFIILAILMNHIDIKKNEKKDQTEAVEPQADLKSTPTIIQQNEKASPAPSLPH